MHDATNNATTPKAAPFGFYDLPATNTLKLAVQRQQAQAQAREAALQAPVRNSTPVQSSAAPEPTLEPMQVEGSSLTFFTGNRNLLRLAVLKQQENDQDARARDWAWSRRTGR